MRSNSLRHLLKTTRFFSLLILASSHLSSYCQEDSGINWTSAPTFDEVLATAKKEGKYIFIDCYTTWCAPCKRMDIEVYSQSEVGKLFNGRFISVRVQMDKTNKDAATVKSWYNTASSFEKNYKITEYPTFLFLSPEGTIVEKKSGYKAPEEFVQVARIALIPGKKYDDPYSNYDLLVKNYEKGKREYSKMPMMIETAMKLQDKELTDRLKNDYYSYLKKLKEKDLLVPAKISFLSKIINSSGDSFFSLFLKKSDKIATVMKNKYFSTRVVDRVVRNEMIVPIRNQFFQKHSLKEIDQNRLDPNWDSAHQLIAASYGNLVADRVLRMERREFYWQFKSRKLDFVAQCISQLQHGDIDTKGTDDDVWLNVCAWTIFEESQDKNQHLLAIDWMKQLLNKNHAFTQFVCLPLDTYANLLFKASMLYGINKFDLAAEMQQKALDNAIVNNYNVAKYKEVLNKIRNKIPTWPSK